MLTQQLSGLVSPSAVFQKFYSNMWEAVALVVEQVVQLPKDWQLKSLLVRLVLGQNT